MKIFKWGKRKLTFVVIPDAKRSVMQLRIPNIIVLTAMLFIFAVMAFAAILYSLHMKTLLNDAILKTKLSQSSQNFNNVVGKKDLTIAELQNQVIGLSKQTDDMKKKLNELNQLKDQLLSITNSISSKHKDQAVSIASAHNDSPAAGKGGDPIGVTEQEMITLALNTKTDLKSLDQQINLLNSSFTQMEEKAVAYKHLLAITPSIWPTVSHNISSSYGYRRDPITGRPSFHDGIDIAGNYNDPIYATADGTVEFAGYKHARGNNVLINHSNGIKTIYMHLHKILVKNGEHVKKGQLIGRMGSTGRSTGTHLHYGLFKNGKITNPWSYMHGQRS